MSMRSIVSEALRNVSSGTSHAVLLTLIWSVVLAGAVLTDFVGLSSILDSASRFQAAGSNVAVMISGGRIDGDICAQMAKFPNVQAAGAIRAAATDLVPDKAPGAAIPTREVTSGVLQILTGKSNVTPSAGVFLSSDVATALGTTNGQTMLIGGREATVGGVFPYPADGRTSGLGFSILEPVTQSGRFDECWVQIWPQSDEVLSLMSGTVTDSSDTSKPPVLTQLNTTLGTTFPSQKLFEGRPSRYLPILVAIVGACLGFGSLWSRRLEFASARHLGVTPRNQATQVIIESASWNLTGGILAFAVALVAGSQLPSGDAASLVLSTSLGVGTGLIAVVVGSMLVIGAINERNFLRYFRDR